MLLPARPPIPLPSAGILDALRSDGALGVVGRATRAGVLHADEFQRHRVRGAGPVLAVGGREHGARNRIREGGAVRSDFRARGAEDDRHQGDGGGDCQEPGRKLDGSSHRGLLLDVQAMSTHYAQVRGMSRPMPGCPSRPPFRRRDRPPSGRTAIIPAVNGSPDDTPEGAAAGARVGSLGKRLRGWMGEPSSYWLTRFVVLRLLGLVYFVAFLSLSRQVLPLICSLGLLPVGIFLQRLVTHFVSRLAAFLLYPSL